MNGQWNICSNVSKNYTRVYKLSLNEIVVKYYTYVKKKNK